jgi:hypothetical protein
LVVVGKGIEAVVVGAGVVAVVVAGDAAAWAGTTRLFTTGLVHCSGNTKGASAPPPRAPRRI